MTATSAAVDKRAQPPSRKALLLRVGIDRGTGGTLSPIFCDGTFEYVPIPEAVPTRSTLTFATVRGRYVRSLATPLPARLATRQPHMDPDFTTVTYGDAALPKRRQLLRLMPGDLLVFYAGLMPWPPDDTPRLFIIGWFRVRDAYHLFARDIGRGDLQRRFGRTAHFLRRRRDPELALVQGAREGSRFLLRALPLGDGRDRLLRDLDGWGYRGSILRSVGHWINGSHGVSALERWLRAGPASLVSSHTRLVSVATSALSFAARDRDLAIDDRRPRVGDWVIAVQASEHAHACVVALGRVNRVADNDGRRQAFCSLYWHFENGGPALPKFAFSQRSPAREEAGSPSIKRLVSWFYRRYRIGLHRKARQRGRLNQRASPAQHRLSKTLESGQLDAR